nr:filamentous hemagglutinin N-terminal domain-containing protein [Planctomycetales bacterium]NIP71024.1 filamentous hemagglutinin N-terminal domain-containing protein [Planctomycetales bacterium]
MSIYTRRLKKTFAFIYRWTLSLVTSLSLVVGTAPVMANPVGGVVVNGAASIQSSGNTLTVNQATDRAVINWQGFSIDAGEITQFNLPSNSSAVLNRVTSGNPSSLLGTLNSNGNVYLINPNGILVGSNAQVNVGGLVASTLDVSNNQFMKGGPLDFSGSSQNGIVNHGNIQAIDGDIYMIANHVENHGTLHAPQGTVGLAAGQSVTLIEGGHPSLKVKPSQDSVGTTRTGITNTGLIEAVQVELAAHGNIYALAINNQGTIRATGSVQRDGEVYLVAGGGEIVNSGQIIEHAADNQTLENSTTQLAAADDSTTSTSSHTDDSNNDNAHGGNVGTGNQGNGFGNTGPGNQGNDTTNGNANQGDSNQGGGNQGGGNQGGGNQGSGNQGGGNQGGGNQGGGNQGGGNQGGGNQGGGNQGGGNQGGGNQGGGNQGGGNQGGGNQGGGNQGGGNQGGGNQGGGNQGGGNQGGGNQGGGNQGGGNQGGGNQGGGNQGGGNQGGGNQGGGNQGGGNQGGGNQGGGNQGGGNQGGGNQGGGNQGGGN